MLEILAELQSQQLGVGGWVGREGKEAVSSSEHGGLELRPCQLGDGCVT